MARCLAHKVARERDADVILIVDPKGLYSRHQRMVGRMRTFPVHVMPGGRMSEDLRIDAISPEVAALVACGPPLVPEHGSMSNLRRRAKSSTAPSALCFTDRRMRPPSEARVDPDTNHLPLPLDERLYRAGQHVVRAKLFLDLWFFFEEKTTRAKIINTMREYNEFFHSAPHTYLLSIHRPHRGDVWFDRTRNTISLTRLAKEMKAARLIQGQEAAEPDALLAEAAPIAGKNTTSCATAPLRTEDVPASRMMRFSGWPR